MSFGRIFCTASIASLDVQRCPTQNDLPGGSKTSDQSLPRLLERPIFEQAAAFPVMRLDGLVLHLVQPGMSKDPKSQGRPVLKGVENLFQIEHGVP